MSLRAKLHLGHLLLLLGLGVLAAICLWGLGVQRSHVRASLNEYSIIQMVESTESHVIAARANFQHKNTDSAVVLPDLRQALASLRQYKVLLSRYDAILPPEIGTDQQAEAKRKTRSALAKLTTLIGILETPKRGGVSAEVGGTSEPDANAATAPPTFDALADDLTGELAKLLRVCNGFVHQTELTSDHDLHVTTLAVGGLALVVLVAAVLTSLWQYRRILVPLLGLRRWSRKIARGDFSERFRPSGDREFVELGQDFNDMADELCAFYRQLEEMVAAKSRELVRGERLASVGYLAAGVAHEINNPLNIMSGYAELSAKRLRRLSEQQVIAEAVGEVLHWQQVIREEAFRCREITGKLLSLARGGSEGRGIVSLAAVASDVADLVRGLRNFQGRILRIAIASDEPFNVRANETEMKQVLLNLVVNALEAVSPDHGEVTIDARRDGTWVEVTVRDNGRGMSLQTLQRVFEPFYTDKRGIGPPGTGLGLSITYAIVSDHGGQIRAYSDGMGEGSLFTLRLPACEIEGARPVVKASSPQLLEMTP